jgi:hypothetical protein
MDGVLPQARRIIDGQALIPALATTSLIECLDGNPGGACAHAAEIDPGWLHGTAPIGDVLRVLVACGGTGHARALLESLTDGPPRVMHSVVTGRALLAERAGETEVAVERYLDAVARWRDFGNPYEQAHALAGCSRGLAAMGRVERSRSCAAEAAVIFSRLGVERPEALYPVADGSAPATCRPCR